MDEDIRRRLITLGQGVCVSALIGALYALIQGLPVSVLPRSASAGILICGFVMSFELFIVEGRLGRGLVSLPFSLMILVKTLAYVFMIALALICIGLFFPPMRGDQAFTVRAFLTTSASLQDLAFSFVVSVIFNIVISLNNILGRGVLLNFLTGRYHMPKEEARIFLLIDLIGSTTAAERLGNLKYHQYLNRFFQTLGPAILNNDGRIHAYVGDEMIVEWPEERGIAKARCLRAVRDAFDIVAECAPQFEKDFNLVPAFRAVLHVGPVVTGEMGGAKREIVYLGDTLNVAARMEAHAKDVTERILISETLLDRLKRPPFVRIRPLGRVSLRGVSQPVALAALDF